MLIRDHIRLLQGALPFLVRIVYSLGIESGQKPFDELTEFISYEQL